MRGSHGNVAAPIIFIPIRPFDLAAPHRLACTAHRKPPSQKGFGKFTATRGYDAGSVSFDIVAIWRRAPALGSRFSTCCRACRRAGQLSPYAETPSAALARYVRALASDPQDFSSLVGAGRAAIALGDAQAAAGFFARADEVNPRSPLPQAGMGAVSVANGEPRAALPYFTRAQQLGAPVTTFAVERGLAYDLMGQQKQAQADYRLAINGPDGDEARRRLALSLAISGTVRERWRRLLR